MTELPLITKYRPQSFEEMLGNDAAIKALISAVRSPACPHAFLLTGPSGVGKTTLARIIAKEKGASVLEIDAASNGGIDSTKQLVELSTFKPVIQEKAKLYILDEAHGFSKPAFQPLLKLLEEPPDWLYIVLATTEDGKIPPTIKTRCYPVVLKSLKQNDIADLIAAVAEIEGWTVANDTFNAIVQTAEGSPRRALSILQAGHAVQTRDELAAIVAGVDTENNTVVELARYLISGKRNWRQIATYLSKVEDDEEALAIGARYIYGAMLRSEEDQAIQLWKLLEAIIQPVGTWDKKIQLASAVGRFLFSNQVF